MRSDATNALAPKLIGQCPAPGQQVCTARGAVAVEDLAKGRGFEAICFDHNSHRAMSRGRRERWLRAVSLEVRLHSDKGSCVPTP